MEEGADPVLLMLAQTTAGLSNGEHRRQEARLSLLLVLDGLAKGRYEELRSNPSFNAVIRTLYAKTWGSPPPRNPGQPLASYLREPARR